MIELFPSLISADLLNLEKVIHELDPYCQGYHLDIMDFHFVQNLTWGPDFINSIRLTTKKKIHVHLMVEYPEKYFDRFKLNYGDIISIHFEAPSKYKLEDLLKMISDIKLTPSLALSPKTPINVLDNYKFVGLKNILLMSVEPGFSGQRFIENSINKLKELNLFRKINNLDFNIAVDGGINSKNINSLILNGANQIIIASAIFNTNNIINNIISINNIINNY